MLWGIRAVAVLVLAGLLWMLLKPQTSPSATASTPPYNLDRTTQTSPAASAPAPTVSSLNASAPVRVTVYQENAGGVASFSDRMDRGQPHVIDHSKGNTYQSTYRGEVPNTASLTYTPSSSIDPIENLRQDNARFQQQVQHAKEQRVQAAIGE